MTEFLNWPPGASNENYAFTAANKQFTFGYDNVNWSHKAEDYGCTLETTDTGFRMTINELFKQKDGSLYPFYGIDYWLIPKNLDCLKKIEEMARTNGRTKNQPYITLDNTITARGTSASANVIIGINNDFMPISKTSETYLDLMDGTRQKLEDKDNGNGTTIRDTPDGIQAKDIKRYVMKYRVVLNKDAERLNDGNPITAEDEYSSNLSVDFPSIKITTEPSEAASQVSYDFSGNIGYFTIPDETKVVIEYEAVVLEKSAGNIGTSNEVRMLQYKKTVDDMVDHGGAGGSSATNPAILIKKYGAGHMEKGLNGAKFQLFEYNHLAYTKGDSNTAADWTAVMLTDRDSSETRPAIFETTNLTVGDTHYGDGYAEIELRQERDGTTLQLGKVYGLREIQTPVGTSTNGDRIDYENPHSDNFYCYVFTICRENETADYSNYVYLPDDTMTVRNTPESISLGLKKELKGNCTLSAAEKTQLHYQVFRKERPAENQEAVYMPILTDELDEHGDVIIDPETNKPKRVLDPNYVNITYAQVANENGVDISGLTVTHGTTVGEYLLVEYGNETILSAHPDWSWRGSYEWNDGTTGSFTNASFTVFDEKGENPQTVKGVAFMVTSQEIKDGESKSVTLTNAYHREELTLTAGKRWANPSGSAITWSGKRVVFALGTLDDSGAFSEVSPQKHITLDNSKDALGEDVPGSAVFKNLPKYEVVGGKCREIRYAVKETTAVPGYDTVYPDTAFEYAAFGANSLVKIKNQVQSTAISVSKAWDRGIIPSGASATFRLYSYTGSDPADATWVLNVNDITLDGTVDGGEGTFGEREAWKASFTGLPKYDSSGNELSYIVRELKCTPANYEAEQQYAANGATITNKPASASFTVRKEWSGTPGDTWPAGETITLELRRKTRDGAEDQSFSAQYVLSSDAIVSQSAIVNPYGEQSQLGAWSSGTLTVTDLPKYDSDRNEWLYYITETAVVDSAGANCSGSYETKYYSKTNYLQSVDYTYSGGKVKNISAKKELSISKTVSGNMGDKTRDFRFTVTLQNGSTPFSGVVNCRKGTEQNTVTFVAGSAAVSLKHGESVTLLGLPGSAAYTVTESETDAADYATTITGADTVNGRTASGSLSGNPVIAFRNEKTILIVSGIDTRSALWALLALFPMLLGVFVWKRGTRGKYAKETALLSALRRWTRG